MAANKKAAGLRTRAASKDTHANLTSSPLRCRAAADCFLDAAILLREHDYAGARRAALCGLLALDRESIL
jgi:hypothetical protein